ncbi:hypothetical protein BCR34DRAFT_594694 [Clohesyomyces aquaticus]|uniref:Uncharacterized protein n=1 Tax=Clohesyomyces aquaticus TaxID=1231657 RepID=A0A1Y1Y652_9PLEO|nr:hypothetical protein BCR34DRAFT_594694 [Clohesyomyces aquaticus]
MHRKREGTDDLGLTRVGFGVLVSQNGLSFEHQTARLHFGTPAEAVDIFLDRRTFYAGKLPTNQEVHQVQRMKEIYEDAITLFVCLGLESNPKIDVAAKILCRDVDEDERRSKFFALHRLLEQHHDPFLGLIEICGKSYWDRLCIIQEILSVRKVLIVLVDVDPKSVKPACNLRRPVLFPGTPNLGNHVTFYHRVSGPGNVRRERLRNGGCGATSLGETAIPSIWMTQEQRSRRRRGVEAVLLETERRFVQRLRLYWNAGLLQAAINILHSATEQDKKRNL